MNEALRGRFRFAMLEGADWQIANRRLEQKKWDGNRPDQHFGEWMGADCTTP